MPRLLNAGAALCMCVLWSCLLKTPAFSEKRCDADGLCGEGYSCNQKKWECVRKPGLIQKKDGGSGGDEVAVGDESDAGASDAVGPTDGEVCGWTCNREGEQKCLDQDAYAVCGDFNNDGCIEWSEARQCPAGLVCDTDGGGCAPVSCVPGASDCDGNVMRKCNMDSTGYESLLDCAAARQVCRAGQCVQCDQQCRGKCGGEEDGCGGACPDPCNGHGLCDAGGCVCSIGYAGERCDSCAMEFESYPDCVHCGLLGEPCCSGGACALSAACGNDEMCACPADMARIGDTNVCIDRYEASLAPNSMARSEIGFRPWVNVNRGGAKAGCEATGKRLCASAEWKAACRGPQGFVYPYGNAYSAGTCNDQNTATECTSNGVGVQSAGDFPMCEGGYPGIFDMSGNVWEWLSDYDSQTGKCALLGGSVDCCRRAECPTCANLVWRECTLQYRAIGFRCCKTF